MPNIREKLIKIVGQKEAWLPNVGTLAMQTLRFVDHLIANGVTAQGWIPVTERLPDEEGLYLVVVTNDHERRYSKTAWYHGHGNWFLHQKVTHWMPLPAPPKGDCL